MCVCVAAVGGAARLVPRATRVVAPGALLSIVCGMHVLRMLKASKLPDVRLKSMHGCSVKPCLGKARTLV